VKEHDVRLLAGHVLVDRDDLDDPNVRDPQGRFSYIVIPALAAIGCK